MFYSNDISFFVKRRLGVLSQNAFVGLVMVFLMLFIFFDWKTTFWTTLGIPVAFCGAMLTLTFMGMNLNLMTMFGFIIVVGMIVDDAIIVSENIKSPVKETLIEVLNEEVAKRTSLQWEQTTNWKEKGNQERTNHTASGSVSQGDLARLSAASGRHGQDWKSSVFFVSKSPHRSSPQGAGCAAQE